MARCVLEAGHDVACPPAESDGEGRAAGARDDGGGAATGVQGAFEYESGRALGTMAGSTFTGPCAGREREGAQSSLMAGSTFTGPGVCWDSESEGEESELAPAMCKPAFGAGGHGGLGGVRGRGGEGRLGRGVAEDVGLMGWVDADMEMDAGPDASEGADLDAGGGENVGAGWAAERAVAAEHAASFVTHDAVGERGVGRGGLAAAAAARASAAAHTAPAGAAAAATATRTPQGQLTAKRGRAAAPASDDHHHDATEAGASKRARRVQQAEQVAAWRVALQHHMALVAQVDLPTLSQGAQVRVFNFQGLS